MFSVYRSKVYATVVPRGENRYFFYSGSAVVQWFLEEAAQNGTSKNPMQDATDLLRQIFFWGVMLCQYNIFLSMVLWRWLACFASHCFASVLTTACRIMIGAVSCLFSNCC
jgi:hypothetical protein